MTIYKSASESAEEAKKASDLSTRWSETMAAAIKTAKTDELAEWARRASVAWKSAAAAAAEAELALRAAASVEAWEERERIPSVLALNHPPVDASWLDNFTPWPTWEEWKSDPDLRRRWGCPVENRKKRSKA